MNYLVNWLIWIIFLLISFDELKYGQEKDYGCFLLANVKTTDKVRNDSLYIVNVQC